MRERKLYKISIIVPIFNLERYIGRCINSIIKQTLHEWELILVDDGSTDDSISICRKYEENDSRIRLICQENMGVSFARNIGIENAQGKYISFVDGDDWIEPDMYELMWEKADKTGATIIIAGHMDDYGDCIYNKFRSGYSKVFGIRQARVEFFKQNLYGWGPFAKLYTRELLKFCKFNTKLTIAEDMLFNWQILNISQSILYLPIYKYHYYHRENSAMMNTFSKKINQALIVKYLIYRETKYHLPKYKFLAGCVYTGELAGQIKKMILCNTENEKYLVKKYQKILRKNFYYAFMYPCTNIITLRQRAGIFFGILPYKICKYLRRYL